jgi:hypothetical protein
VAGAKIVRKHWYGTSPIALVRNAKVTRRIGPILDQTAARNSRPNITHIHSKLDCYNLIFLNLPANQLDWLQICSILLLVLLPCRTSKFHHVTPVLKSLHWRKLTERLTLLMSSIKYLTLVVQGGRIFLQVYLEF